MNRHCIDAVLGAHALALSLHCIALRRAGDTSKFVQSVAYTTYKFEVACTLQNNVQSVAQTKYTFAVACTLEKNFQSGAQTTYTFEVVCTLQKKSKRCHNNILI